MYNRRNPKTQNALVLPPFSRGCARACVIRRISVCFFYKEHFYCARIKVGWWCWEYAQFGAVLLSKPTPSDVYCPQHLLVDSFESSLAVPSLEFSSVHQSSLWCGAAKQLIKGSRGEGFICSLPCFGKNILTDFVFGCIFLCPFCLFVDILSGTK